MISNNWCGSTPLFFEKLTSEVTGPHLKPHTNPKYDWTGLGLYLKAGYCIFGLTPFEGYSYLQANESIINGVVQNRNVEYLRSIVAQPDVAPQQAVEAIGKWIENLEKSTTEKIVIPLSGGLDSRLLISFIQDKSRIEAFTYGQSWTQRKSNEVVTAMELSKKLNFNWRHIELGGYSNLTSEWISRWGSSTHAHGMYQMQFYEKISKVVPPGSIVLSGIIGDLLAGSLRSHRFSGPEDLWELTLSRQMNAREIMNKLNRPKDMSQERSFLENVFQKYEEFLKNKRATDLLTIQNKNMLLRFLVEVPTWYGLKSASPFLNEQIGQQMLCIDDGERLNRKWQRDFLEKVGLGDSNLGRPGLFSNVLNFSELNKGLVDVRDINNDSELINEKSRMQMTKGIKYLRAPKFRILHQSTEISMLSYISRLFLRLTRKRYNFGLAMYYSYLTLLPLQRREKQ